MNEIYILKNNLSTTATSGHQIYYKENNNIKLLVSHLAFGTIDLTSYLFALKEIKAVVGLNVVNTGSVGCDQNSWRL